jgi:hypothetical protein
MKKIFFLGLLLFTLPGIAQKIVYDANAEIRNVGKFSKLNISGAIDVHLLQGAETALAISTKDGKYNDRVKTEIKNGTLFIQVNYNGWKWKEWGNMVVNAYLTVEDLTKIEINGASQLKIQDVLRLSFLELEVSGASSVKGDIQVKKLQLQVSGASSTNLEGSVEEATIEATGASTLKGYDLVVESCNIQVSGASTAKVTVSKTLVANASGASSLRYRGNCSIVNINSSGASSIRRADD